MSAPSAPIPPTPPSPGFGLKRKGPKALPKLPLSAFTPPNSGTSERFPLAPSPSTVHPDSIVDAHIAHDLAVWKSEAGSILGERSGGVVLSFQGKTEDQVNEAVASLQGSSIPILAVSLPFDLTSTVAPLPTLPSSSIPLAYNAVYTSSQAESIDNLRRALESGHVVDIAVNFAPDNAQSEALEELIGKASADIANVKPVVISGILPPPSDVELPIVKLMNHPSYNAYQAQTASLSLLSNVYVKFTPPTWTATPASDGADSKEKEWKRRIKMYLGPVIEAFGYQRIIFGSSPALGTSPSILKAGAWYELARESLAELGLEQEMINAIFYENAKRVYNSS